MRLRPSGTSGPLATSLAAFRRYHDEAAWTWEQMALTRARAVAGAPELCCRVMAEVEAVLRRPRDPDRLVADVASMRRRITEQHRNPPFWDVKHRPGGMIDIEFIAQYLQLRAAAAHPEALRQNTAAALVALGKAGALAAEATAELGEVLALWRNVQSLLKLTVEEPFDDEHASPALRGLLASGAGAVDFARLKTDMGAAAERTRRHYEALVEALAAAAQARLDTATPGTAEEQAS
jgi:glutamate-ammonia-ligase adenylyltransferase